MNCKYLKHIVGLADACELMSESFSFPTKELVTALIDNTYIADARSCLSDIEASPDVGICHSPSSAESRSSCMQAMFEDLRRSYTMLYLMPAGAVRIWPYESAFRYRAEGCGGTPTLFRSRHQIDVERHMREAGVMPNDSRREPSDSVWNEFAFLSFLYGSLAAALHEGCDADVVACRRRIVSFWSEHASRWLPAFMGQTRVEAEALPRFAPYAAFAEVGLAVLAAIEVDAVACDEVADAAGDGGEDSGVVPRPVV